MKIFKAFILGAAVESSALNQERVRRQGDIDWNFINSNSNGNTVGNGEIFRINKYIASVYVSDRYARTELALAVKNNDLVNNQKYNFAVNLKDDEFISGLTMRIGQNGTVSTGDVHKELAAAEIFAKAVENGLGAALTSKDPQDPVPYRDSTFSTILNIPPGENAFIWLNYDTQLSRNRKHYDFSTTVFPYDAVDELEIRVDIEENKEIDSANTKIYFESDGRPKNQRKDGKFDLTKVTDSHYSYKLSKKNVKKEDFNDNLVVEYDLVRTDADSCGDIIVRNGFFVHYIAPEGFDSIPKNVILTIDTSGSMGNERMEMAKEALLTILSELRAKDTFWMQEFNSDTYAWNSDEAALPANPKNIKEASDWVRSLSSGGGTNLYGAIQKSVERKLDNSRANIAFVITDGEPTSGVTSWPLIQDYTRDLNSMDACTELDACRQKWALFNFAIGGNAPMTELNKLSILNMGQAKQVFDDSEVPKVLTEWYDEFSIPLIWNYGKGVEYENVKDFDCNNNYNLFADRELVCVGPMKKPESCLAPSVSMSSSNNAGSVFSFDHQKCPIDIKCSDSDDDQIIGDPNDIMTNPIPRSRAVDLKKVYAYQQMKKMMDYYHSLYDEDHKKFLQSKIEDFAVGQDFVTEFTSLVVVQSDKPRNRRGAQKIAKPLPNLNVQVKKKRSQEKKEQIQKYFEQYNQAKKHSINSLDSQSDKPIVKEDIVRSSFESSHVKTPNNDSLIRDDQKSSPRKTLMYILLSILALKLFSSRRGRSLIRF
jgi:uncharacterized protein YegL